MFQEILLIGSLVMRCWKAVGLVYEMQRVGEIRFTGCFAPSLWHVQCLVRGLEGISTLRLSVLTSQ